MTFKSIIFFLCCLLIIVGFVFTSETSRGEGGVDVITTWNAENLYPSNYEGKALPSNGNKFNVSAEIVVDGKLIDASNVSFKWYLDKKLYESGAGLKNISFYAKNRAGSSHSVKLLVDIDGQIITKYIEIPVVSREVVIESPFPGNIISPNTSVIFTATPYFFDVSSLSDLDITWKIQNSEIKNEKKNTLFVQFGEPKTNSQKELKISSLIKQKENSLETAKYNLLLRIE